MRRIKNKRRKLTVDAFDSVGAQIAKSVNPRRDATRPEWEICSMSKTTLPMAINFVTLGQTRLGPGCRELKREPTSRDGRLKNEGEGERREEAQRAYSRFYNSWTKEGPRGILCRIVKRLCPDDLHPVLAMLSLSLVRYDQLITARLLSPRDTPSLSANRTAASRN